MKPELRAARPFSLKTQFPKQERTPLLFFFLQCPKRKSRQPNAQHCRSGPYIQRIQYR